MMDNKVFSPRTLIQIGQPLNLLLGLFTYCLGLGIHHYLSVSVQWPAALLGLLLVIVLLISHSYLKAYFRYPDPMPSMGITRLDMDGELKFVETKDVPRNVLLQMALAALGLGATITIVLTIMQAVDLPLFIILTISLILVMLDALPPVQLCKKGYSELIEAFLIANFIPAVAFLLQQENMHILLLMFTLPLTFIYLALQIAASFEYYAYDLRHASGSLLAVMGWQRGMVIHNLSLILSFLLYAVFLFFGLSWKLTWPVFLVLPFAGLQILQIVRIGEGAKPNWRLFRVNSMGTFLLVVYLIAFTLWIN
jgi:1,4-dihydroxy-2-naphthoate octaprenyltransferase